MREIAPAFVNYLRSRYNGYPMRWFKAKHLPTPQQLTPPTTRFLAEQDGAPERDLKARFIELFREQPTVERAYLS